MNPREKRMVIVLGVLLGLLAAWTVKSQYVKKLDSLDAQIVNLKKDRERIDSEKRRLKKGKESWAETGHQTLALEEGQAQTLFRPDVDALVQEVGLSKASVTLKGVTKSGKNGLRSLNCTVTAEGQLDNILQFMFKVHQRPYLVRCRGITVDRLTGKNIPKNTLRLNADLDTLLLPDAKADGLPRVQPVDITSRPAEVPSRTRLAKLDDYQTIVKRKVFEPWTPPVPKPGKVVGHNPAPGGQLAVTNQVFSWAKPAHAQTYEVFMGEANPPPSASQSVTAESFRPPAALTLGKTYYWRVDSINVEGVRTEGDVVQFTVYQPTTPEIKPPPPVAQRPEDENLVLSRIISSERGQQVVLENPSNKTVEDKRVEIGDTLWGGKLVFVHPKGAVSHKEDKLWYHPLTKALREAVPLTEQSQPELLYEVMKLEQQAAGISQKPG